MYIVIAIYILRTTSCGKDSRSWNGDSIVLLSASKITTSPKSLLGTFCKKYYKIIVLHIHMHTHTHIHTITTYLTEKKFLL